MGNGSEEKEIYKSKGSLEGISQPFCGPDGIINMIIVIVIAAVAHFPSLCQLLPVEGALPIASVTLHTQEFRGTSQEVISLWLYREVQEL